MEGVCGSSDRAWRVNRLSVSDESRDERREAEEEEEVYDSEIGEPGMLSSEGEGCEIESLRTGGLVLAQVSFCSSADAATDLAERADEALDEMELLRRRDAELLEEEREPDAKESVEVPERDVRDMRGASWYARSRTTIGIISCNIVSGEREDSPEESSVTYGVVPRMRPSF